MTDAQALPINRKCPYTPPNEHVRLREEEPIARVTLPSGDTAWALTKHEDIRAMLADVRFSSDRNNPGYPYLQSAMRMKTKARPSLISTDPPEHGPARRAVIGEFTVRRMAELRPRIQQTVDQHIDALLAGPRPADLVRELSLPVPSLVICELLGVPYSDHEFFQQRACTLLRWDTPPEERFAAIAELMSYLDDLVARKERESREDLLSRQFAKTNDHEVTASLGFLLLVAGHDTTASMISLGTMMLLEYPGALAAIRDDPAKTPAAVEELLRYFTIAEYAICRVAVADVELGGVTIRAGEGVIGLCNTANRDPAAFDHADEFRIERDARHHLAFGFGAHQCLGQNLARTILVTVFDTLFRRIPGLRLAKPVDELPFKEDAGVYGLHALPVTW